MEMCITNQVQMKAVCLYRKVKMQWRSEYRISQVFKWSKRGWMPNGPEFEYHTAQPFEYYLTNGRHLVFLCTGPVLEWSA